MIFQVYDCQEIKTCKTVQMISMCQGAQVKAKAAEAARAPNPAARASHLLVQPWLSLRLRARELVF